MIPQNQKSKKSTRRLILVIALALFIIVGILGVKAVYSYFTEPIGTDSTVVLITIEDGETAASVGKKLKASELIRSDIAFRLWVKRYAIVLQAGEYEIPKNLSLNSVAQLLTHGTFDTQITFPEGLRREELITLIFSENSLPTITCRDCSITREEAERLALNELLQSAEEGFLFPDTYTLSKASTLEELIGFMSENFWMKYSQYVENLASTSGLTTNEIVTLASIIEREVRTDTDRKLVAGILRKRLDNSWNLDTDASLQYAVGSVNCDGNVGCEWWPKELTLQDLELDSPYNSRKVGGLPPTPICNPSLSSMIAVVEPTESSYWYYLSDSEGNTHFAETLEQHNRNITLYL